jgi:3-oxoacyl-[acyl-carrier-protein] synthase II
MKRRRVVVTGVGAVAPGANDAATLFSNLAAGRSAAAEISRFDASAYPTRIAAEVRGFSVLDAPDARPEWAGYDRIAQLACSAAAQAVEDSGLLLAALDRSRAGVLVAAGLGSYEHDEVFASCAAAGANGGFDAEAFTRTLAARIRPRPAERRTPGTVPALVARHFGFTGPVMTVMTACAAGTQAIGDAVRWIRSGAADVVLAGGADSELYPMGLASFCLLGALSKRNDEPQAASRPFDSTRDGFLLGEGAGVLVLEERDRALARGARIRAEIAGFGSACDAYRATDPHPDGDGALLAMSRALHEARLSPDEVGYVNAHGTSTVANDRAETRALKRLFGERAKRVPVSSTKSMIGHLTVAAGAAEAIATVLTLESGTIPPTINLRTPDPDCDLDYVPNEARHARVDFALSNSFAFGGQCASLVLARAEA